MSTLSDAIDAYHDREHALINHWCDAVESWKAIEDEWTARWLADENDPMLTELAQRSDALIARARELDHERRDNRVAFAFAHPELE